MEYAVEDFQCSGSNLHGVGSGDVKPDGVESHVLLQVFAEAVAVNEHCDLPCHRALTAQNIGAACGEVSYRFSQIAEVANHVAEAAAGADGLPLQNL